MKVILKPVAAAYGIFETIIAVLTLSSHGGSWDTLPFIDPLLWLSWVTIYDFLMLFSPLAATLSCAIGMGIYGICFWLCIGYGLKGYGTRQYDVLSVPENCQFKNISWQTDPRRKHFLRLHSLMFACATAGFLGGLLERFDISKGEISLNVVPGDDISQNNRQIKTPITDLIQALVSVMIILPAAVGIIVASALNGHSYLVLGQHGCYASYVSSRFAYLDLYLVEWKIKLGVWIGLIT